MTDALGGGGINLTTLWVNVAPSMSGMQQQMAAGGSQAGSAFTTAFKAVFTGGFSAIMDLVEKGFEKVFHAFNEGLEMTAKSAEYAMQHIFEGKAPDIGDFTPFFQQMEGMIGDVADKMVGWVPIIGDIASSFIKEFTGAFQEVTGVGGEFLSMLQEMGNEWQETARKIQGATGANEEQLERYLEITQKILASGDIVHMEDVANAIGVVGDRLHGVSDEQLAEFTTKVAQAEELLGKFNVGQAVSALNQWGVEGEAAIGKFAGLVHVAQDAKMPFDVLTRQLQQMGPIMQDFGVSLDQTAIFLGRIAKEGFDPARLSYTFQRAATQMVKNGQDIKGALEGIFQSAENLMKVGDQKDAFAFIESVFGPYGGPKTLGAIQNMHVEMTSLFGDMHEGMNENAEDITQQVERTANLQDQFMSIRNRMMGDLRGLAENFSSQLTQAGHSLGDWFEEHHTDVLKFAQGAFDGMFTMVEGIVNFTAKGLGVIAPFMNVIKEGVVFMGNQILDMFRMIGEAASHLPGSWGDAGRDMADAAKDGLDSLHDLQNMDITKAFRDGRNALENDLIPWLDNMKGHADDAVAPLLQFSETMDELRGHMEALPAQHTFKVTGDTRALEEGLKRLNISFEKNADGVVTKIHTTNQKIAEEFETWYKGATGKDLDVNLVLYPVDQHGNPVTDVQQVLPPGEAHAGVASGPMVPTTAPDAPSLPGMTGGPAFGGTGSSTQRPGTASSSSPGVTPYAGSSSGGLRADWDAIAQKESSGRWNEVLTTGVTEGGGLQIKPGTWADFGGTEFAAKPYLASKSDQIKVAERILNGWNGKAGQGPAAWDNGATFVPAPGSGSSAGSGLPSGTSAPQGGIPTPSSLPAPQGGTPSAPAAPAANTWQNVNGWKYHKTSKGAWWVPPELAGEVTDADIHAGDTPANSDKIVWNSQDGKVYIASKHGVGSAAPQVNRNHPEPPPPSPHEGTGGPPVTTGETVPAPAATGPQWLETGGWHYFVNQYGVWWVQPGNPLPTLAPGGGTPINPTGYHWEVRTASGVSGGGGVYVQAKDHTTAASPPQIPPPAPPPVATPPTPTHEGSAGGGTGGGEGGEDPLIGAGAGVGFDARTGARRGNRPGVLDQSPGPGLGIELFGPATAQLGAAGQRGVEGLAARLGYRGMRINPSTAGVSELLEQAAAAEAAGDVKGASALFARALKVDAAAARVAARGGVSPVAGALGRGLGGAGGLAESVAPIVGKIGRGVGLTAGAILPLVTEVIWPSASTSATDIIPDIHQYLPEAMTVNASGQIPLGGQGPTQLAKQAAGWDKDQWTVFVTEFKDLDHDQKTQLLNALSEAERNVIPHDLWPYDYGAPALPPGPLVGDPGSSPPEGHRAGGFVGRFRRGGSVRFDSGGHVPGGFGDPIGPGVNPAATSLNQRAAAMAGIPYQLGAKGGDEGGLAFDCSALVGNLISNYLGTPPDTGMYTGNEGAWLSSHGFKPGVGSAGSIQVGFENYSAGGGHTVLRLPNGVNTEASSRPTVGMPHGGVRYGGDALSPLSPMFTDHWYLDVPGVRVTGNAQGFQEGGFLEGHVPYLGPIGRDSVHAILEPGEFVVKRDIAQKHANDLWLLNEGVKTFGHQGGGEAGMDAAEQWAQSLNGQPYNADGWIDCSGLVSGIWSIINGKQPSHVFDTTQFGSDDTAAKWGFAPGYTPGALNIAVDPDPGNAGHMIAQFPDGTVVESGSKGIEYGSKTAMNAGEFRRWYHYDMQEAAGQQQGAAQGPYGPTGGSAPSFSTAPGSGGAGGGGFQMPAGVTQGSQGYVSDPVSGQQVFLGPGAYYKYIYDQKKNEQEIGKAQGDLSTLQSTIATDTGKANEAYTTWQESKSKFDQAVQFVRNALGAGYEQWNPGDPVPAGRDNLFTQPIIEGKSYKDLFDSLNNNMQKMTTAQEKIGTDNQNLADKQSSIDELRSKPADRPKGAEISPDQNAERLGKGLVTGLLQGFGLDGSVFSNPLDWGLTKLLQGGANYGMGKLKQIQEQGSPLLGTGSSTEAPGAPTGNVGGSGLVGVLNSLLPGANQLVQPTASNIPAQMSPPGEPQPGPTGEGGSAPTVNFNVNGVTDPKTIAPIVTNFQIDNSRAAGVTTPSNLPLHHGG